MRSRVVMAVCALVALVPATARAQPAEQPLTVGTPAPDFELTGATRYGVLRDPVRLSDFRGKTVVVAFFYRVRTPG
jgi:hypothetical protein